MPTIYDKIKTCNKCHSQRNTRIYFLSKDGIITFYILKSGSFRNRQRGPI